jgi:hypothetical protein
MVHNLTLYVDKNQCFDKLVDYLSTLIIMLISLACKSK